MGDDAGTAAVESDASGPSVISRENRLGFALTSVLVTAWLACCLWLAGLGITYVAPDTSSTTTFRNGGGSTTVSISDDLGDVVGMFCILIGAVGALAAGAVLQAAVRRARGAAGGVTAWFWLDAVALAAGLWFFRETFRIAAGDGHAPNMWFLAAWAGQSILAGTAAWLLRPGANATSQPHPTQD